MKKSNFLIEDIFYKKPKTRKELTKIEEKMSLGATLYIPSVKDSWGQKYICGGYNSLNTLVIDFEDSILEEDINIKNLEKVKSNLENIVENSLKKNLDNPKIFFRVRNINHASYINDFIEKNNIDNILEGIVLPKANREIVEQSCSILNNNLKIMPIIESREFIDTETRMKSLKDIKELILENRDIRERIVNIRVGGTDLSGIYGLRRTVSNTIYDLKVVERCLTDIVECFGTLEDMVLSGAVWEYFQTKESLEGLIKEIKLDKLNSFIGKTAIHPSQIDIINASYIVEYNDYKDACDILYENKSVLKSNKKDRMNEFKPHKIWAEKTIRLANVYGVLKEEESTDSLYRKILE